MISDVIVAAGFILIAVLLIIKFNKLIAINEAKLSELTSNFNDWKKQIEQQQEGFQSNLLSHTQQSSTALQQTWKQAIEDLKEIAEKEQQAFKEQLKVLEQSQEQLKMNLLEYGKEVKETLQDTWEQANRGLISLMEAEHVSRKELLQDVAAVQETNCAQLQAQKEQIDTLQRSNEDVTAKLVNFIEQTKQVAVNTERYQQQMTTDLALFTTSMHELFDIKVKKEHELLLKSEQTINQSLQAIVKAGDSNLERYKEAIQEITTIQNSQSQLMLLMKKTQEEHHKKIETYQVELRENLEEIFDGKLNELNEKNREQNQEILLVFEEIKEELQDVINSVSDTQKETSVTFKDFGTILKTLDDSLKQTIQVTKTMQMEMKTLGEKDIKLLEKILG